MKNIIAIALFIFSAQSYSNTPENSQPTTISISPNTIAPLKGTENQPLTIKDYNLDLENIYIEISGKKLHPKKRSKAIIEFSIPGNLLKFKKLESTKIPITLHGTKAPSWIMSFFQQNEKIEKNLYITLLPKKLGILDISYNQTVKKSQSEVVRKTFQVTKTKKDWQCQDFKHTPASGRKINPSSLKHKQTNGRSGKYSIIKKSETEISLQLCAKRWSQFSMNRVGSTPGFISIEAEWSEYWSKITRKKTNKQYPIEDWKTITITAPKNTTSVNIKTTLFNGEKYSLTTTGNLGELLHIDYNDKTNVITVNPLPPKPL